MRVHGLFKKLFKSVIYDEFAASEAYVMQHKMIESNFKIHSGHSINIHTITSRQNVKVELSNLNFAVIK